MATAPPLPAIVLVPGGFQTPWHYEKLLHNLQALGFETHCPQLPTSSGRTDATLSDDVATIRRELDPLVSAGRRVILVAHSFGGIPTSNATRGYSLRERRAEGLPGGVVHVVYMCAFMLLAQEAARSVGETSKSPTSCVEIREDGMAVSVGLESLVYSDQPPERQRELGARLNSFCARAAAEACTWQPWIMMPVTYIYGERDLLVSQEAQKRFVRKAKDVGGVVLEETFDCDHSPYESMPEKVAELVVKIHKRPNDLEI